MPPRGPAIWTSNTKSLISRAISSIWPLPSSGRSPLLVPQPQTRPNMIIAIARNPISQFYAHRWRVDIAETTNSAVLRLKTFSNWQLNSINGELAIY